jgi:hypothetical protein
LRQAGWLTYPLASHGTMTTVSMDTVVAQLGNTKIYEAQSVTYIGPENLSIAGEPIETVKFLRLGTTGQSVYDSIYQWVAPKLGYIVRSQLVRNRHTPNPVFNVTSYHLK